MPSVRSGMSIGIGLMLILTLVLMVLSTSKADAQTACQMKLDTLENAIVMSATFTNEQDKHNLLTKLQNAETKLAKGKTADAVAKIEDIRSAVAKLAAGGKVEGADAIDAAAVAAIECIEGTSSA